MRVKKLFKYILAISISFIILSNPFFVLQNKTDALSVNLESEITGSAFLSDEIDDKFVTLFYRRLQNEVAILFQKVCLFKFNYIITKWIWWFFICVLHKKNGILYTKEIDFINMIWYHIYNRI